ncbi:lysine transporter LysE [Pantoea stewartii]|uniref:LysE family translocator n=1 Tax=Pantoea stewartii TaxID=66269 RepID=UPI00054254D4|nr:LysE family translocator [Pantoea stewartii]KHD99254.1 lysine transporter LysE [Pantoea stewartii]KHN65641.1 lysine transporter LysE [Pantoea stewartii]
MQQISVYILIASLTIATPGPGVILTLTNTLNYSLRSALAGIAGVTVGMGTVSAAAASSLGLIITSTPSALLSLKIAGALYLAYLGTKLFRSAPGNLTHADTSSAKRPPPSSGRRFCQGLVVTLLNPKAILFFMVLFPQFIDSEENFIPQVILMSVIFCTLVILIHSAYGLSAHAIKNKIASGHLFGMLNKAGGLVFMLFSAGLIVSSIKPYL